MGKKRILIIDDDLDFTGLVKSNLEKTGRYEVRVENSGWQSLDAAKAFQPDLVLLDFMMPDMDGSEVAERMRGDEAVKNIPIVFLTSMVSEEEVTSHAGVIGGNRFITKVQPMQKLMECIERCMTE